LRPPDHHGHVDGTQAARSVAPAATNGQRRTRERAALDLCVVGDGPTAVLVALSARERGLSVALINEPEAPAATPGIGIVGHRHPYGYRWLTRWYGSRAARQFAAAARSGRHHLERLVATHAIPCALDVSTCHLGALAQDARSFRRELDAMDRAGIGTSGVAPAGLGVPPSMSAWHRLPDERALDPDALVRCGADLAATRGVVVDASPVGWVHRRPGLHGPWSVTTEDDRYLSHHLIQTGPTLADHRPRGSRTVSANVLVVDTAQPAQEGRYALHARRPVEVVAREHSSLGYRQLVVSRFGGRSAVDAGFEAWAARSWSDGLLRDRWWGEAPIRRGFPVYGQVGRSRRWLLGGLGLWGIAVQSHVADRVAAAVDADRLGVPASSRLAWPQPAPFAARPASG
jgi:hypothetical protein